MAHHLRGALILVITTAAAATALASVLTAADSDHFPLIEWPSDCDEYTEPLTASGPQIESVHQTHISHSSQCRPQCTSRDDCGGFVVYFDGQPGGGLCTMYNMNDQVMSDLRLSNNWFGDNHQTWLSKTCPYSVGLSDTSCNVYKDQYEAGQYVRKDSEWMKLRTNRIYNNLTAAECQRWCTLYSGCRSALREWDRSFVAGRCYLFNTTISALLTEGGPHAGDVLQLTDPLSEYSYTTYDRYCDEQTPYVPPDTPGGPSTPTVNPMATSTESAAANSTAAPAANYRGVSKSVTLIYSVGGMLMYKLAVQSGY